MNEEITRPRPVCVGCNKTPVEIEEYRDAVADDPEMFADEDDYVRREEGTFNFTNGHFLCTDCYIDAGMPSSPTGWVAP